MFTSRHTGDAMLVQTLFIKLLFLLYTAIQFALNQQEMPGPALFGILSFVFVHALCTALPQKSVRILLCLFGCLSAFFVRPSFPEALYLLPITLYDLVRLLQIEKWAAIAISATASAATLDLEGISLTLVMFGAYVIVIDIAHTLENERTKLHKQNDDLRIRTDELSKRLAHDQEYRRQLTQNTQLEERNRIAQEIHDRVGHTISGSLMQLEAARVVLAKDPDKVETIIVGVIRNLREGLESIRQTLKNIKPGSTTLGINRIRLILDDFTARHAIKTTLESAGELSVIEQNMWRIIQENLSEALTNTVRHGSANMVRVWIRILNKLVRVEIHDNGVGCPVVHKGMGLSGMEERLSTIEGRLIADGSDGFSLIMLIPYRSSTKNTAPITEEQRS